MIRHKLIADLEILVILLCLSISVSNAIASYQSNKVFSGVAYALSTYPVQGASVSASGPEGYGYATTNSLGEYTITEELGTGNYTVTASAEYYVDAKITDVSVTSGLETTNVDLLLNASGAILGRVTDAVSSQPLQNVYVRAYNATGGTTDGPSASTDSNGNYQIVTNLPTGTYNVTASYVSGHLDKTVNGISVTAGVETTDVNFALEKSGIISGTVTDAVSTLPLQNILISASAAGGEFNGIATTNSSGKYRIDTNLGTGNYNVTAWFPEEHISKTVPGVFLTAGAQVTVDMALEPSGIISGKVTRTPGGQPLEGASVTAYSAGYVYVGSNETNAAGEYRIESGLGTETYTVMATFNSDFGIYPLDVDVVAGSETPNIDIQIVLTPSGTITGRVTNTTGDPIENALVTAEGPGGYGQADTNSNGDYAILTGLGDGAYNVTASATGYLDKNMSNVNVIVDQVTPNIDFQLSPKPIPPSGRISGKVQSAAMVVPEFPYSTPILVFVTSTCIALAFAKLYIAKVKRTKPS